MTKTLIVCATSSIVTTAKPVPGEPFGGASAGPAEVRGEGERHGVGWCGAKRGKGDGTRDGHQTGHGLHLEQCRATA